MHSADGPDGGRAPPLLEIEKLSVRFNTPGGVVQAVGEVSLTLAEGETLGLVGESGSGKSVTALSIMRLLPKNAMIAGQIRVRGEDLLALDNASMRRIRTRAVAMVFQDPMTSLNPVLAIGSQVMEPLMLHLQLSQPQARRRAVELLSMVGIPAAERRMNDLPYEFSGGMRQRVMIAMALSCGPRLLIADEPTTALDVTVQAQILELIMRLQRDLGMALLLITHDLGVVAGIADRVSVMYAGRIVESGPTRQIFARPRMPYTIGLLRSAPRLDLFQRQHRLSHISGAPPDMTELFESCAFQPRCDHAQDVCGREMPPLRLVAPDQRAACLFDVEAPWANGAPAEQVSAADAVVRPTGDQSPILTVQDVQVYFPIFAGVVWRRRVGTIRAVDGVTLKVQRGETLGLVGESGCGKSTLGRAILQLVRPTFGSVQFAGTEMTRLSHGALRRQRRRLQVIFQDPYASLNPRKRVGDMIAEPILVHGLRQGAGAVQGRVCELLQMVGLAASHAGRYPHEFSGGQRQRIGIARALAVEPELIVCDEAVSALDVSIQAQVLNLLRELQDRLGLTYLFIAHGLHVVRHVSDRVAVMYLGRIVELAPSDVLYRHPLHPYTQALLSAVPVPDPGVERQRKRIILHGELPSPANPPTGCRFHTRCPMVVADCLSIDPPLVDLGSGRQVACWRAAEWA